MAKERNSNLARLVRADNRAGETSQIDYSYTQWRHAWVRQLEQDYEVECARNLRLA